MIYSQVFQKTISLLNLNSPELYSLVYILIDMDLTKKDVLKLKKVKKFVDEGTACSFHKKEVSHLLESILNPKCAVCRKPIGEEMEVVNQRKMHPGCRKKYEK